jgi:quinol monooxygenase YgiN
MTDAVPADDTEAPVASPRPLFVIDIELKPGTAEEFWALAERLVAMARTEPGVVRYDIVQELGDPHKVILMEQFRDMAAVDAHTKLLVERFGPPEEGSQQMAPAAITRFFGKASLRQVRVCGQS